MNFYFRIQLVHLSNLLNLSYIHLTKTRFLSNHDYITFIYLYIITHCAQKYLAVPEHNIVDLKNLLGHKNITTTEVYLQKNEKQLNH